jgi:hypothetical protein
MLQYLILGILEIVCAPYHIFQRFKECSITKMRETQDDELQFVMLVLEARKKQKKNTYILCLFVCK